MRNPQPFRSLSKLAFEIFLILFTGTPNFAQQPREIIPSYPSGALASFPESLHDQVEKIGEIYFRTVDGGDPVIWEVEPRSVLLPDRAGAAGQLKMELGIGFFVPQLPRGNYIAWYESSSKKVLQAMKLAIAPALLTDQGIERVTPGGEVEVRIKIFSPNVARRDFATPQLVKAAITLRSSDPDIADLSQGQTAVVSTNREGFGSWKIRVNKPGIAEFRGTAEGFDPITVIVVGMPRPAPTFLEAALLDARLRSQEAEIAASDSVARVSELERETREKEKRLSDNSAAAGAAAGRPHKEVKRKLESEATAVREARQKQQVAIAETRVKTEQVLAARAEVSYLNNQLATQPPSITEADLKPGDIILVRGTMPFFSAAITKFEKLELGGETPYSHAALYLGKANGVSKVAEMLFQGFYVSSLKDSTQSDLLVDVYRWEGIDDAKRQEIANLAAFPFGPGAGSGAAIPYAVSQIDVLSYIAAKDIPLIGSVLGNLDLRALVALADGSAGGKRKMICSELVAWVYRDAGLDLDVTHWKRLRDLSLLNNEDRRKDYTTPNMLARSRSLHLIGRYLGP